jgi:hypothetical protein
VVSRGQDVRAKGDEQVGDVERLCTDRAAICSAVAPTSTSQPRAAAATVSNCAATVASASSRRRSGVIGSGGPEAVRVRSSGPIGVTVKPSPSIHSRKSGGTQRCTPAPSDLKAAASATSGCTSPRDPIVESNTRIEGSFRKDRPDGRWEGRL